MWALGWMLWLGCGEPIGAEPSAARHEAVERVRVRAEAGTIALIATDEPGPAVRAEGGAATRERVVDGTLVVEIVGGLASERVTIEIPAGVDVDVAIGDGDLDLIGLDGRIAATLERGSIDGDHLAAEVFVARLRSGDVAAAFGPELRAFDARVEQGSVGLLVEAGAWRLGLDQADGEGVTAGVAAGEDAGRSIVAAAPNGRVYVEGR